MCGRVSKTLSVGKGKSRRYEGSILELSAKVLDARLASYKTGSASRLDVLTAQKADSDVRLASVDALSERAKALIALEQAANIWDIDWIGRKWQTENFITSERCGRCGYFVRRLS